jgi:hypothetical protein
MDDHISRFERILASEALRLRTIDEAASVKQRGAGKWRAKEVLGHLIDSAVNNHIRFVRAQIQGGYEGPSYQQKEWVDTQAYVKEEWALLVDLWVSYNRHLLHVMKHSDAAKLQVPCRIGGGGAVTLKFVMEDYLDHMENHLRQIVG